MFSRKALLVALVAMSLLAPVSEAMTSHDLLIPIAGRTAGALGSYWQSDLLITNAARTTQTVNVTFIPTTAPMRTKSFSLAPGQTLFLDDFALNEFGVLQDFGQVRVSGGAGSRFTAQARIWNIGSGAGHFGQVIPGVPLDALTRESLVTGVSSINGYRTNFGVTNPWNVAIPVTIEVLETSGDFRGSFNTTVPALGSLQYNDVRNFANGEPLDNATIRVRSAAGVYSWASVVRNDSGDPSFVMGSGITTGNDLLLPAACANPAPVTLVAPGAAEAPGWIVMFTETTNAASRTATLAAKYNFVPSHVYEAAFKGFSAVFTPETLAAIRCEADVTHIYQNQFAYPAN